MYSRKVRQSLERGNLVGPYDHYVAIDWSQRIMAIAHKSQRDAVPRVFERPADLKELKLFLRSLKGRVIVTVEESGVAHWLYLELFDYVDHILVCNPYRNRLLNHGPKTDKIDAGKLCDLLAGGFLQEVYHSESALYDVRTLVSGYDDVVMAGVRVQNQKKALKLAHKEERKNTPFIDGILEQHVDLYRRSKKEYLQQFESLVRHNRLMSLQKALTGIGNIGAVKIVATVVDARRFPSAGHYLSYAGLVRNEKISGGRSYGFRRSRFNRTLKFIYKHAALVALRGKNPFREYYDALLERGVAERSARHMLARYIARISYGMLKTGTPYEPYRWRKQTEKVRTATSLP